MNLFLYPDKISIGQQIPLSREQSNHVLKVLRAKEGQQIGLINGRGVKGTASIVSMDRKVCIVEVTDIETRELNWKITVAFAVPKTGALEFIVKRCTELGVHSFQPLETHHSRHRDLREDRAVRLIEEVCKQCQELYFPTIAPVIPLKKWLDAHNSESPIVFCDELEREGQEEVPAGRPGYSLLVGPEGGWSDVERELILAKEAIRFGLGQNRLRCETAALTGTVLLKQRIGEF